MKQHDPNKKSYRFSPREITALVGVFFLCITITIAGTAYNTFQDKGAQGSALFNPFVANPSEQEAAQGESIPYSPETGSKIEVPPPPKWDGATRVTMLIMGLDYRDWIGNMGPPRTDTMILLTIDPISKTAGMLSIPRDLWANIPGFKPQKINTAYRFGELYNYPGGGPALAIKTVEGTIGVPIDYYAQIDFGAFVRFIDLIGGVKIRVTEPIELEVIDKRVDVYLEPGVYALGGDIALAYARARNTKGGDFDRARRQQQVVMAIRDRLLNPEIFSILLENADQIYTELSTGIQTNLPLEDAIKLAFLGLQIEDNDIKKGVLGESAFLYGRSPDDLSILIPLPDKIREIRDLVFATGGAFSPLMSGEPRALMQVEGASISIYNGSTSGNLADRTAEFLQSQGGNIVSIGTADTIYSQTRITIHSGKPYTLAYLVSLMRINSNKIFHSFSPNSPVDVEIILGNDWNNNNPMP